MVDANLNFKFEFRSWTEPTSLDRDSGGGLRRRGCEGKRGEGEEMGREKRDKDNRIREERVQ